MSSEYELKLDAQVAVQNMKNIILKLLEKYPDGLRQSEIGRKLGTYENPEGKQNGWVEAYLLRSLLNDALVLKEGNMWRRKTS